MWVRFPPGTFLCDVVSPTLSRNVGESALRLIDSNFPILGLRPPPCCVYVAPLPAGSIRSLPLAHPYGLGLCRSLPSGSVPAGNVLLSFACLRFLSNVRELRLRLIDSNFSILGLRPPRCCVYVAPLPTGSIRSLPLAHPLRA